MKNALKNPHYKKIWEKVIMNRHPEAKTLEGALIMEKGYKACVIEIDDREFQYTNMDAIEMTESYSYMEDGSFEILQILGRPITLFDILKLLNAKPQEDYSSYIADGVGIFKYFIDWRPAELVCNFETNSLCETAPETWEKIAGLI